MKNITYREEFINRCGGPHGTHKKFTRNAWKEEVAHGWTQMGYWEWAIGKVNMDELEG